MRQLNIYIKGEPPSQQDEFAPAFTALLFADAVFFWFFPLVSREHIFQPLKTGQRNV